jgi:hypothetical protein
MNGKTIGLVAAAVVGVLLLLWVANRSSAALRASLPPKVTCLNASDAGMKTLIWAMENPGGRIVPVLGTGSMAPYIPAAPPGQNPMETVVAVMGARRVPFAEVKEGDLILYAADFSPGHPVCHVVAKKDQYGLVMSGINNEHTESWARVTEGNYLAKVVVVWVWPL